MRKTKLFAAALCSLCMVAGASLPAYADGMKVVTLGADLSDAQKQTMMRYFKANSNEVQILTVTNADERAHLGGYVPLEQIGTRTVSCAYVRPTNSGGIKVRTANLNYVTGNMIAATLSTSGVKNCEVIAACPFEVSGTGALTGIQMAYETASGTKLDPVKKDIATEEIVVTEKLASDMGNATAIDVINKAKMEVIQKDVQNADEIYNIVNNVVTQNNININTEQMDHVVALLEKIAEQDYEYEDMEETLNHIDENVSGEFLSDAMGDAKDAMDFDEDSDDAGDDENAGDEEDELDFDSILNDIDESELGENVVTSSTEDQSLELETYGEEAVFGSETEDGSNDDGFEEFDFNDVEDLGGDDEFTFEGDDNTTDEGEDEFGFEDTDVDEGIDEDDGSTTTDDAGMSSDNGAQTKAAEIDEMSGKLSEQSRYQYEKLEKFCDGEYKDDSSALSEAMGDDFFASYVIDDDAVEDKLSETVRYQYLKILTEGTGSYIPSGDEKYMNVELCMMDEYLKKLFGVDGKTLDAGEEDILSSISAGDRELLYKDTIRFFEKMYGEESFGEETEAPADDETFEDPNEFPEETSFEDTETGFEEADYSEEDYSGEETDWGEEESWDFEETDGDF